MPKPGQEPPRVFELKRFISERRHDVLVLFAERRARRVDEPIAAPRRRVAQQRELQASKVRERVVRARVDRAVAPPSSRREVILVVVPVMHMAMSPLTSNLITRVQFPMCVEINKAYPNPPGTFPEDLCFSIDILPAYGYWLALASVLLSALSLMWALGRLSDGIRSVDGALSSAAADVARSVEALVEGGIPRTSSNSAVDQRLHALTELLAPRTTGLRAGSRSLMLLVAGVGVAAVAVGALMAVQASDVMAVNIALELYEGLQAAAQRIGVGG